MTTLTSAPAVTHLLPNIWTERVLCGAEGERDAVIGTDATTCPDCLLVLLTRARNYSYEATMGDYSMGSINRAAADLAAIKNRYAELGLELPAW
jgi:hypothetical protein